MKMVKLKNKTQSIKRQYSQTLSLDLRICYCSHPASGPPLEMSKTWWGFRSFLKLYRSSLPFRPPLFGLTNTRSGQTSAASLLSLERKTTVTEQKLQHLNQSEEPSTTCAFYFISYMNWSMVCQWTDLGDWLTRDHQVSYLDFWDDEWSEHLVVDRCVFSQHVDPLCFRETWDLQCHRTWKVHLQLLKYCVWVQISGSFRFRPLLHDIRSDSCGYLTNEDLYKENI